MSSAPDLDLQFATLAERPELMPHVNSFPDDSVAEFLYHDPVSTALFVELIERHPEFTISARGGHGLNPEIVPQLPQQSSDRFG